MLWLMSIFILFGFLSPALLPLWYIYRCFLVPLYYLIVRRPNLGLMTRKFYYQQVKNWAQFSVMSRLEVCPHSFSGGIDNSGMVLIENLIPHLRLYYRICRDIHVLGLSPQPQCLRPPNLAECWLTMGDSHV